MFDFSGEQLVQFSCKSSDNPSIIEKKSYCSGDKEMCVQGVCQEIICVDSDNGKNKYIIGYTELQLKSDSSIKSVKQGYDSCVDDTYLVLEDNLNENSFYKHKLNFLSKTVLERYCDGTKPNLNKEIMACDETELCEYGSCVTKEKLFCNLKKYYLEGDYYYYGGIFYFIISDGTMTNLYLLKGVLDWNSVNNNIYFESNPNDNIMKDDGSVKGYWKKSFQFIDGKETTFEHEGIKFTLLIDTVKKSIFFKDLGTYPPELQNIQCS